MSAALPHALVNVVETPTIAMARVPILIVNDSAAQRSAMRSVLAPLGCSIVEADSGLESLRRVMAQDFAVIVLDVCMPGMDGFETAAMIRQREQSEMTPLIFITAYGSDEIPSSDLYAAGAVDFIFAPVPADALRAKVSVFANLFLRAREVAARAEDVQRAELELLNHELMAIARRDALTGLGNRRALEEDLELMEARATRYGHRYCVALLDVDHFKSYNDTYGQPAGDQFLRIVAGELKVQARGGDALYRYGGEEFLCIFPEQSLETGTIAVERMRTGIERQATPHAETPLGVLTISAGLAMLDPGDPRSVDEVVKDADDALYRAKQLGRNRVELTMPQPE